MAEKVGLLALEDFGQGDLGYATADGVRKLPVPNAVKPDMYVIAVFAVRAGQQS